MSKEKKAAVETAGRVPLLQGDRPLIYPRYNSIEELLKIGQGEANPNNGDVKSDGAPAGERPTKKQKRAAAAATVTDAQGEGDNAAAAARAKGFSVVGEDGLTYKQRRQMRRAAERAARAQAEGAAGEITNGGIALTDNGATITTAAGADGEQRNDTGAKKQDSKKKDNKEEKQGREAAGAAAAAAAAAVKGNAEEAAKMRAVLGFVNGSGVGGLSLAALAAAAPAAAAADGAGDRDEQMAEAAGTEAVEAAAGPSKKQKKDKKKGRKGEEERQEGDAAAAVTAVTAEEGGNTSQVEAQVGPEPPQQQQQQQQQQQEEGAPASTKPSKGAKAKASTKAGGKPFSFEFQVQAEVEAETEARLARLMALDSSKDGFVPRRIWVSGLPHEFDADTVREYWGYCGEVEDMHLLTFRDSGRFNGAAFITFKTQEGYEAALACNGEMLEGRPLRVEKCKVAAELKGKERAGTVGGAAAGAAAVGSTGGAARGTAPSGKVEGYPVAYCGNIAFEVEVEDLQQLFSRAGAVPTKVRLHTDKNTGRSKGYAHVHFATDEDVDKAVALDGTNLQGRKIKVSYANPKQGGSS